MWAVHNQTAYAADRTWVRDKHGRHHWIVVVKATFELEPDGRLRLADEQLTPLDEPEYFGEPGRSSLRYEADLVAAKPGTDLILNAHAHAPGGRPTQEVVVTLRLGDLEKTLLVRGESRYQLGLVGAAISTPAPFVSRAIVYEHAFGGTDTLDPDPARHRIDLRNPVGAGLALRDQHLHGKRAPSVFYPRGNPAKVGPAGFAAIASHWSPRLELGGSYDQRWALTKKPLLPDDYDEAQLMCSPADQRQRGQLRGGERIELHNMTPAGELVLELPSIVLTASTRVARRTVERGFNLSTIVIEPEDRRLIMVWQSSLVVASSEIDEPDVSRVREVA